MLSEKDIAYILKESGSKKTSWIHIYRKNEQLVKITTEDRCYIFEKLNCLPNRLSIKISKNVPIRRGVFIHNPI